MYYDLSETKRTQINQLSQSLLEKQNEFVATDLEQIIDELPELDLHQADFDKKISGYIQKDSNTEADSDDDDDWNIFINENDSDIRQRFTIAHELGHYLLHLQGTEVNERIDLKEMYRHLLNYSSQDLAQEHEADYFASCLLMPEYKVKKAWEAYKNIKDCANAFAVSEGAMYYRLQEFLLVD